MPRLQGSKNKLTAEIKQRIYDALNTTIDNLETDLQQLTTKERLEIFSRLLPYILPKLKETDLTVTDTQNPSEIRVNIIHPNHE
jgi:CHASE3 domain sensor protein